MDEFALFMDEIEGLETNRALEAEERENRIESKTFSKENDERLLKVTIIAKAVIKRDMFEPEGRPGDEADAVDDESEKTNASMFAPTQFPNAFRTSALPGTMKGPVHGIKTVGQPVQRFVAGEKWTDCTLSEWPENDYRIFVGDLGPECSDEQLAKAFQAYASFAKARVVRDKKTMKSRGYGFVSILDSLDFAKAMKEVHGTWIGSRPCKLRKSTWEERNDSAAANAKGKHSHNKRAGWKNIGGLGEMAGGKKRKGSGSQFSLKHNRKHLAVAPSIEKYKAT